MRQKKELVGGPALKWLSVHTLDERGKVFIEYGPGTHAWMPVVAPGLDGDGGAFGFREDSKGTGMARLCCSPR